MKEQERVVVLVEYAFRLEPQEREVIVNGVSVGAAAPVGFQKDSWTYRKEMKVDKGSLVSVRGTPKASSVEVSRIPA